MEFIEYKRAPSGEVRVADHPLADIFNVDDDSEPAGAFPVPRCIAHVVMRLDDSEREAAERLAETDTWRLDHEFRSADEVVVPVAYAAEPERFSFADDAEAQACVAEVQQLVDSVPLDLSRATCRALLANRLLDVASDKEMFGEAVDRLAGHIREFDATHVASIEARGWLLGPAVARTARVSFIPIVKNGPRPEEEDGWEKQACRKVEVLPGRWSGRAGALGTVFCVNRVHVQEGRVLLVDDWVETGSEATAARRLIQKAGGTWQGLSVMRDGLVDGPARRGITPILSLYRPSSVI
jgi:adenine phosphoribosyltransferase